MVVLCDPAAWATADHLQLGSETGAAGTCFCKERFIETQQPSFVYVMSLAAFVPHRWS